MKAHRLIFLLAAALVTTGCATLSTEPAVALHAAKTAGDEPATKQARHNYYGHVTLVRIAGPAGEPTCLIVEGSPRDCNGQDCLSAKDVTIDADLKAGKLVLEASPDVVKRLGACVVDGVGIQLVDAQGVTLMAFTSTAATRVALQPVAPGVCEMAIKEQGIPSKPKASK